MRAQKALPPSLQAKATRFTLLIRSALSAFGVVQTSAQLVVITVALTVISIAYAAWILRQKRA